MNRGLFNYESNIMKDFDTATPYPAFATAIRELDEKIKLHSDMLSALKKEREHLTDSILPQKMQEEGLSTVNVRGLGRFSVRNEMRVSVPANKKFELQEWLKENGYGELIAATVNSSTLKSFVKESIMEGRDYPDQLLNIHSFERATLTKV